MQPDNSSGETNSPETNQPNIPPEPSSVQEQPPENTNAPVKKKRSKKIFIILAAIFVVLLLALISFLIWQNYQNKQTINDYQGCATASGSVIQESYPETCVTKNGQRFVRQLPDEEKKNLEQPQDLISNWKTYTDEITGYQISYPKDMVITHVDSGGISIAPTDGTGPIIILNVSIFPMIGGGPAVEVVVEDFTQYPGFSKITLGENEFIKYVYEENSYNLQNKEHGVLYTIVTPQKDNSINIVVYLDNLEDQLDLAESILSTFKFLPENCGPCPAYDLPPDFCLDGEVVFGEKDECGCTGPPECVR